MESTFGGRVRQFRQEKGLSQQAFAERCDLTQGNIAHMENGTEPKQSNVTKLVGGFPDLNPDWLLLGTGPMLRDGKVLTPVVTVAAEAEPPRYTSKTETVAEAENILLRELLAGKDEIIAMLRVELGKFPGSPDAAGPTKPTPAKPVAGFLTSTQRQEIAEAFNEVVEEEMSEGEVVVVRR